MRASERFDEAEDLDELWTMVAAEAAGVLGASAKVMQWTGQHWVVLDQYPVEEDDGESATTRAAVKRSVGPDEDQPDDAVLFPPPGVMVGHARSVLVTDLECSELRAPTRLVWTSPERDAFGTATDLAAEYTRFTSSAVRRTHARIHLQRAVTARHRVGQAQGIVMARLELAAADAFEVLLRRSQNTNVKLRVLADHIIRISELEAAAATARGEVIDASDRGEPGPTGLHGDQQGPSTRALLAIADPAPDTGVITPELSDALSEAIITGTGDAAERAEVMCTVVEEMRASVEWLNAAASTEELRSLGPAVGALHEHLHRMLFLPAAETS